MNDKKILLVDDQRSHLKMMKQMLERFRWNSVTVDSAEEAEFILEWYDDFQAIITDLKMPWMDGVEFCINTKLKHPDLKIYALSGNLQSYKKHLLDNAGFDGIYQKPVTLETIEDILNAIGKGWSDNQDQQPKIKIIV